jgi:hypothetical protein
MPRYYNKTRSVLTLSLRDGSSVALPPRSYFTPEVSQIRSSDLARKVSKGYLVEVPTPQELVPEVVPVVEPTPVEVVSANPAPDSSWRKADLVTLAETRGFAVEGLTKREILTLLTGSDT